MTIGFAFCIEPYGIGVVFDTRLVAVGLDSDGDLDVTEVIGENYWKIHTPARGVFVGIAGAIRDAEDLLRRVAVPIESNDPHRFVDAYHSELQVGYSSLIQDGRFGPSRPCALRLLLGSYAPDHAPHGLLTTLGFRGPIVERHDERGPQSMIVIGCTAAVQQVIMQKAGAELDALVNMEWEVFDAGVPTGELPPNLPVDSGGVGFRMVAEGGQPLQYLWAKLAEARQRMPGGDRHPAGHPMTLAVGLVRTSVAATAQALKGLDVQFARSIGEHFVVGSLSSRGFRVHSDPSDPVVQTMIEVLGVPRRMPGT